MDEDALIMIITGWSYQELMETPENIVDQIMTYNSMQNEYTRAKMEEQAESSPGVEEQ